MDKSEITDISNEEDLNCNSTEEFEENSLSELIEEDAKERFNCWIKIEEVKAMNVLKYIVKIKHYKLNV